MYTALIENVDKLKVHWSAQDRIYKSVSVIIDFECGYDNVYNNIDASDVIVVGDNDEAVAQDGKGKFEFTLTQYKDVNLTDSITENDATSLGSKLYFQLAMENPVSRLTYSLVGKSFSCTIYWFLRNLIGWYNQLFSKAWEN